MNIDKLKDWIKAVVIGLLFVLPWIGLSKLPGTKAEPYVVGAIYLVMLYFLGRFILWVYRAASKGE